MDLVKVFILAALTTLCHCQSGDVPGMNDEIDDTNITIFRSYRSMNESDLVYSSGIYNDDLARTQRYAHYNVSYLIAT